MGYRRFSSLFLVIIAICFISIESVNAVDTNKKWENAEHYILLEKGTASNSDIVYATLDVLYDYELNRIYLLFSLCCNKVSQENLSGLKMNFNSLGDITLMADETNNYDTDIYYADTQGNFDYYSKTLCWDTTVGIKEGIPDSVVLKVSFFDTHGAASNTITVDITPNSQNVIEDTIAQSTKKTRTTKNSNKKYRTTKNKTTKVSEEDNQANEVTVKLKEEPIEKADNRSTVFLVAAISTVVVCTAAGCITEIKKKKNTK